MGRDVTGLRVEKKPGPVNVRTNQNTVHVSPKALPDNVETKDNEPVDNESTIKEKIVEINNKKQLGVSGIKSPNHEPEEKIITVEATKSTSKKSNSPVKPASDSAVNEMLDAISLEPTTLAEKNDSGVKTISPQSSDLHSYEATKKSEPSSPIMATKQQHNMHNKKDYSESDNWSLASSSATSSMKPRVTVPVAPRFCCGERLERRREFYSKLEEKHKALERERLEQETRIREEEQTAIKQLRKTMVYKANPIPSFYREGPPPKAELKKLPVTRAKSPKLTRRKSCGDAVKMSIDDKGLYGQATRHSVGTYRDGKNSSITPRGKDRTGSQKLNGNVGSNETTENSHVTEEHGDGAGNAVESC